MSDFITIVQALAKVRTMCGEVQTNVVACGRLGGRLGRLDPAMEQTKGRPGYEKAYAATHELAEEAGSYVEQFMAAPEQASKLEWLQGKLSKAWNRAGDKEAFAQFNTRITECETGLGLLRSSDHG